MNVPARKDPITEKSNTLNRYLEGREDELVKALRGFVDPKHFIRVGVTLYRQGGKGTLIECTPESVMASLFEGAQLGLSPDPHLGEFWLVLRSTKVGGEWVKRATFQIGVQGLVKLARRSGEVLSVQPEAVYRGDEFSLRLGTEDRKIIHVPDPTADRSSENLIAVYAVAELLGKNGMITRQSTWMPRYDIDESADRSKNKQGERGDAWKNHYKSMAQVRVVGRLCKWLPRCDELSIALHRDSMREMGIEPDSVIQVDPEPARRRTINQLAAAERPMAPVEEPPAEPPSDHDTREDGDTDPPATPDPLDEYA